MRVGVIVRMEADTDINEKFAEVRAMGMESWYAGSGRLSTMRRQQKRFWRQLKNTGLPSVHSGVAGVAEKSGIFMMVS